MPVIGAHLSPAWGAGIPTPPRSTSNGGLSSLATRELPFTPVAPCHGCGRSFAPVKRVAAATSSATTGMTSAIVAVAAAAAVVGSVALLAAAAWVAPAAGGRRRRWPWRRPPRDGAATAAIAPSSPPPPLAASVQVADGLGGGKTLVPTQRVGTDAADIVDGAEVSCWSWRGSWRRLGGGSTGGLKPTGAADTAAAAAVIRDAAAAGGWPRLPPLARLVDAPGVVAADKVVAPDTTPKQTAVEAVPQDRPPSPLPPLPPWRPPPTRVVRDRVADGSGAPDAVLPVVGGRGSPMPRSPLGGGATPPHVQAVMRSVADPDERLEALLDAVAAGEVVLPDLAARTSLSDGDCDGQDEWWWQ